MAESPVPSLSREDIAKHSKGLTALGILLIALGVLAIAAKREARLCLSPGFFEKEPVIRCMPITLFPTFLKRDSPAALGYGTFN